MIPKALVAYNGLDTGLGNRMRVLLSSHVLAEAEDRQLLYVWPTGARFGACLQDLFDYSPGLRIARSVSRLLARRYPYRDASLDWMNVATRRELVWQIRTGRPLDLPSTLDTWGERLRGLIPQPEIAERVCTFFQRELRDEPYVGVMIRAHAVSHEETKKASPVEWFIERMRKVREQNPTARFFISCDVAAVQRLVSEAVGNCVGQVAKGPYNSAPALKASVVDLYLLASAQHLIAPHYSSFIHMAQHLGGDQVPIETSRTETPATVELAQLGLVRDPLHPAARAPVQASPQ